MHCCVVGANTKHKSLLIDIEKFVEDFIQGGLVWMKENKQKSNYISNSSKLIKRYPNGVKPIIGTSIIG